MSKNTGEEAVGRDEDLDAVDRCRKGDDAAFEEIVLKYQKRMMNISYRITGSYEDACEVAQDAFLSAYRNLAGFRGQSRFSTWLYAITVNLSKNRVHHLKARTRHEPCSADDPVLTDDGETRRETASSDPSPVEELEAKERGMKIQECIGRLDPEFRAVIVLRDVQGFSYHEISAMLGQAEGTVKSRLFRARESVRDCLKRIWGGL